MYGPSWSTRGRDTKKEKKTQKIHLFQVVAPIKLCTVKTAVLAGGALALLSTFYDNIDGIQKAI